MKKREIKFRAKIKETYFQNIPSGWGEKDGDWVEGHYYFDTHCVCNGYPCDCDGVIQDIIRVDGQGDYPIILSTLSQFIGIKDKNGKDIYEGDIVKSKLLYKDGRYFENTDIVEWDKEECSFMLGKGLRHFHKDLILEVIGNIYDIHDSYKYVKKGNNHL